MEPQHAENSPKATGQRRAGRGAMNGNKTGVPFSATNQPDPAAKKAGMIKRRFGKELARALLEQDFKGAEGSKLKSACAQYLGIPEDEVTVEVMLHFRQLEKAISKSDTAAYNAFMDRAYGKPAQALTGEDGGPIQTQTGPLQLTPEAARAIAQNLEHDV